MRRVIGAFIIISFLAFLVSCSSAPKGKPEESNEIKNQAAEYTEFGNRFFYKAQYSQALSFFEMALEENISVFNEPGIVQSYNSIGKVYLASGRTDDAMDSYSQAYTLAKTLENPILLAECENNIGEVYLRTEETEKALEMFTKALERDGEEKKEESLTPAKRAILYHNTGHAYKKSGDLQKAEELFTRALAINLNEKNLENAAGNYYSLSSIYSKQEKYTEAVAHMEMALDYDKRAENSKGIAKDLLALGLIQEKAGNLDISYEYFKKSFLVHRSLQLYREIIDILSHLERLAVKTGHTEEAEAYAETLKNLTSQLDSSSMELIKKALLGYLPILKAIFTIAAVLILLGLVSVVATYPLWWLAVNKSGIFSLISLSLLGAALLWGLIISPVLKKAGTPKEKLKKFFLALWVIFVAGVFLLGAYGLFLLFVKGYYLFFTPLLLCYLLLLGNYLYGKNHS